MAPDDEDATEKFGVVKDVSFGQRVAEEERDSLATYCVETEHWRRVWSGDVNVVFAPKGGGKSAIYSMLVSREGELFDRGVLLAAAENPTGAPAFQEVEREPPTSEAEFVGLWKLYFLALTAQTLLDYDIRGARDSDARHHLARRRTAHGRHGEASRCAARHGLRAALLQPTICRERRDARPDVRDASRGDGQNHIRRVTF